MSSSPFRHHPNEHIRQTLDYFASMRRRRDKAAEAEVLAVSGWIPPNAPTTLSKRQTVIKN